MRFEEICQLLIFDIKNLDGGTFFSSNKNGGSSLFSKHVKTLAVIRTAILQSPTFQQIQGSYVQPIKRERSLPSSGLAVPQDKEHLYKVIMNSYRKVYRPKRPRFSHSDGKYLSPS